MTSTLRDNRAGEVAFAPNSSDVQLDPLADFRAELQQLAAAQRELLDEIGSDSAINLDAEELPRLRQENDELRARVAQLERMLHAAPAGEDAWTVQQTDYERLLDEKSEVIRALHQKVQVFQDAAGPIGPAPEIHDAAAERMKQELADLRAQLEEDEASMMQQMRTMEMALAKDRADLARQRTELQRQQADFAREVENACRDPQLHDRLASLRRRQQDSGGRNFVPAPAPPAAKNSGLIRRIFG